MSKGESVLIAAAGVGLTDTTTGAEVYSHPPGAAVVIRTVTESPSFNTPAVWCPVYWSYSYWIAVYIPCYSIARYIIPNSKGYCVRITYRIVRIVVMVGLVSIIYNNLNTYLQSPNC